MVVAQSTKQCLPCPSIYISVNSEQISIGLLYTYIYLELGKRILAVTKVQLYQQKYSNQSLNSSVIQGIFHVLCVYLCLFLICIDPVQIGQIVRDICDNFKIIIIS